MPSILKSQIQSDFKEAYKEKRTLEIGALRMLMTAIKNKEIEKGKKEKGLSDEEIIEVVTSQIKERKKAAGEYKKGGRKELAEKEEKEAEILEKYLPEQLSQAKKELR